VGTIDFRPGSIVGNYEIVEQIGEGGMAEVYRARSRSGQCVAIKRLLPAIAHDQRFIDMFVLEARLAATLHHPNIAKVHEVGVDYFAMELIDGHDVRTLLTAAISRARPMPLTITLSIMYGTTCALAYVHDLCGPRGPQEKLNLVHRDISPSNILVSFEGAIKLVDFGIARIETGSVTRSASKQIKGKFPYMSPEQCRARPLDGRSDLFSLGVVLYELTTNTRPFDRNSEFDTLEAIVSGDYPRPSKVIPKYPAALEEIVVRLLATRPNDRYPTAGALLVDLDRVISAHDIDLSNDVLAAHIRAHLGNGEPPPPRKRTTPVTSSDATIPTPHGELSAEAKVPIDRIVARADELMRTVAPDVTDPRDLSSEHVAQLIGRALRWHAKGDLESAVLAVELTLSAARNETTDALLTSNESLILSVLTSLIGDQTRTAVPSQYLDALVGIAIDQRAAFLLTRIDGTLSAHELLATCGLPMRDACRHLCQLLLREIVVLV